MEDGGDCTYTDVIEMWRHEEQEMKAKRKPTFDIVLTVSHVIRIDIASRF